MRKYVFALSCCLIVSLAAFAYTTRAGAGRERVRVRQQSPQAPDAIQLQPFITTGLSSPIYLTSARDGTNRIFIAQQGGIIRVVQPGSNVPSVFLDITTRVVNNGERGLIGMAFHPDYETNRRFFLHYTRTSDTFNVVSEFRASATDANVADPATERVLLVMPQPFANHNGGWIDFGPDGYLYIGKGDGGSANDPGNRAQNLDELLGKILRIDVDRPNGSAPYSSPTTNPFFGATAGRDEIYAYGLRNPFRNSFDRATGQLYVGDVGQGAREEVDIITSGGNFGWRVLEGTICTPGINGGVCTPPPNAINPITEYVHNSARCSITGGYVYRGPSGAMPFGAYLFGDYCTGEILQLNPATASGTQTLQLDTARNITSFGEDEAGELYVIGQGGTVDRVIGTTTPCAPSVTPTSQSFTPAGGAGSVQVINTSCGWSASSNVNWITFSQGSNTGTGNGSVAFNVAPNTGVGLRTGTAVVAGQIITITQTGHQKSDFDGDGKTDTAVWRAGTGQWIIINSLDSSTRVQQWGAPDDIIVPADYDGDGKTDIAVFRPSEGNWYIIRSSTGTGMLRGWGQSNDRPVPGDYDGDGTADIAVFRPTDGNWYVLRSSGGATVQGWGTSSDIPVAEDYDGDGKTDLAVFRIGEGNWYILRSGGGVTVQNWGLSSDTPVPGDYDGDKQADVAVFRATEGNWYIRPSTGGVRVRGWGAGGDRLVPGDYDGDGRTDIAVWRPSEGNWYIIRSTNSSASLLSLGMNGDEPVPSAFIQD